MTAQEWTNIMGRLGPWFQVVSPAGRKSLEVVVENPPNPPRTKTPTMEREPEPKKRAGRSGFKERFA